MEGNHLLVECGGWILHPTQGLQNASFYSNNIASDRTVSLNITFTPLSGVFGGTCEKYIPLSVLEGLEVWIQLENVRNCLKNINSFRFLLLQQNQGEQVQVNPS